MSLNNVQLLLASDDGSALDTYKINNSLRFRSDASAYLSRTPASASNRKTWTWSAWVKRGDLYNSQNLYGNADATGYNGFYIWFQGDYLVVYDYSSVELWSVWPTQAFRDPSAWYHIIVAVDTTQATAANRVKIYVNGSQITAFSSTNYPTLNLDTSANTTKTLGLGRTGLYEPYYYDGLVAELYWIDGQALTPSSFGATNTTTGVWRPKAYTGTYGTNGFYLPFSDTSALTTSSNAGLGKDFSGNGNYWTTNNISVTSGTTYDAMIDSPTVTNSATQPVGNYATLNPLMAGTPFQTNAAATVSQGNLQADWGTTSQGSLLSTIAMTSGKWYFEGTVTGTNTREMIGIVNSSAATTTYAGGDANGWGYFSVNGNKYNNGSATSYGATYTTNDVIGVAFDADAGSLTFYKNGTTQGTAFTSLASGTYFFAVSDANSSLACGWNVNFGQRPFAYTPPTGFKALCSSNLLDSTIYAGNQYMDATLYTGTGSSLSVTNAGSFKPDFVWVKSRSDATDHALYDSVRGTTKDLVSNATSAETTEAQGLTAFGTSGFTVGTLAKLNTSTATYVGWQWQAGKGTTSSNTQGSITSTVSVNATAGFSVVTFSNPSTGSTIGHGLGVAPKMMIVKDRNNVSNWQVYHASLGNDANLRLNTTDAINTPSNLWNTTSPTSTVFTFGSGFAGSYSYVVYCFAEISGYSKFGSYTGNGSSDGPFVYLGFRPKFLLVKASSSITGGAEWLIWDTSRSPYNLSQVVLSPNSSSAESDDPTYRGIDIVSNGFKIRCGATNNPVNNSGSDYIYAAFAENPFKYSVAR